MWTAERTEQLRKLWAEGISQQLIGREMGLSKSGIAGKVKRLGLPSREVLVKADHSLVWSEEMTARLLELHAAGKPTRYIAADLGLTIPATSAKLFRLRVDRPRGRRPKTPARLGPLLKQEPFAECPRPKHFIGVTFADLGDEQCRFPHGEPTLFCGQPKMRDSSYCPRCHALCWVKPFTRQQMRAA